LSRAWPSTDAAGRETNVGALTLVSSRANSGVTAVAATRGETPQRARRARIKVSTISRMRSNAQAGAALVGGAAGRNFMRTLLALVALGLVAIPAAPAHALERGRDGFYQTGDGIRYKKIAFIHIKVYSINHEMKELPQQKTKEGVINAEVDKRLQWRMLRSVGAEKIRNALREAYAMNGYNNAGKIATFVNSIDKELKSGDVVTIKYDAAKKTTTMTSPAGSVTVPGEDFMKATWSIWFGKIDDPKLGNELIERL
jgi:hypothetical protein